MKYIEADKRTFGEKAAASIDNVVIDLREAHKNLRHAPGAVSRARAEVTTIGSTRIIKDLDNYRARLDALVEEIEAAYGELAGIVARHGN